jgi:hypothetical protein
LMPQVVPDAKQPSRNIANHGVVIPHTPIGVKLA